MFNMPLKSGYEGGRLDWINLFYPHHLTDVCVKDNQIIDFH